MRVEQKQVLWSRGLNGSKLECNNGGDPFSAKPALTGVQTQARAVRVPMAYGSASHSAEPGVSPAQHEAPRASSAGFQTFDATCPDLAQTPPCLALCLAALPP